MFEVLRTGSVLQQWRMSTVWRETTASQFNTEDLPCPWCRADTKEGDARCPSCGRRFG